jgi:hypothetical protein
MREPTKREPAVKRVRHAVAPTEGGEIQMPQKRGVEHALNGASGVGLFCHQIGAKDFI